MSLINISYEYQNIINATPTRSTMEKQLNIKDVCELIKSSDIEAKILGINLVPQLLCITQARTRFKRKIFGLINKINYCAEHKFLAELYYWINVLIYNLNKKYKKF